MMGPLLAYRDEAHLDGILEALRRANVEVCRAETPRGSAAFRFRRGWGLVRGTSWQTGSRRPVIHLGFGHPFHPWLWPCDGRLVRKIEQAFLANGSSKIEPSSLA